MRLDETVSNQYNISKSKAQDLIAEGRISINQKIVYKKSTLVKESDVVERIETEEFEFVSRAGNKLYHALIESNVSLKDKICLDVGASTGGFSDCCIQMGAAKIYAIDVGSNQLHPSLLNHPKLISFENFNAKDLSVERIGSSFDFLCCDVSFISLTKILFQLSSVANDKADLLLLFKPQFECGSKYLNKHGVVTDQKIIERKMSDVIDFATTLELNHLKTMKSSVVGRSGNQEYILYFKKG